MIYDSIYYININYCCNNNCIFCLSHSTYEKKSGMKYNDILEIKNNINLYSKNRIVINGGEPTLFKDLVSIIHSLKNENLEIVLYSNGRKLAYYDFAESLVASGIDRITIPIHGNKIVHNYITQCDSFDETVKGIKNLLQLKKLYNFSLEIKVIITNELLNENIYIPSILNAQDISIEDIDCFVISALIDSKVNKLNQNEIPDYKLVGDYTQKYFNDIKLKNIKIEDIPLCKIKSLSKNTEIKIKDTFDAFYFYDSTNIKGKKINYKKDKDFFSECKYCNLKDFCGSIMDRYYILLRDENRLWWRCLE